MFDEAVEDTALRHQTADFVGMHIGHGTRQTAVLDMPPLRDAMFLQPDVQGIDIGEVRHWLPQSSPRILHVLLDLSFLPPRRRVTEVHFEQLMARHRGKAGVHLPDFGSNMGQFSMKTLPLPGHFSTTINTL
jgi:hypothetical protein